MTQTTHSGIHTLIDGGLASIHDLACASPEMAGPFIRLAWRSIERGHLSLAAGWLITASHHGSHEWFLQCDRLAAWLESDDAKTLAAVYKTQIFRVEESCGIGDSGATFEEIRRAIAATELVAVFSHDLHTVAFVSASAAGLPLNARASEQLASSISEGQSVMPVYGNAVLAPVRNYGGFHVSPDQAVEHLLDSLARDNAQARIGLATENSSVPTPQNARDDCQ